MNNLAASREVSTPNRQTADLQSALRHERRGIEPGEIEDDSPVAGHKLRGIERR
jgi:hypothetical protein